MYSIIISVVFFTIILLCLIYIIKEVIRRRKRPQKFIESNNNIRGCFLFWGLGVIFGIVETIFYYIGYDNRWNPVAGIEDYEYHLGSCLTILVFIFIAFMYAEKKVIIDIETGDIVACSIFGIKKIHVRDITLIKSTFDTDVVYSGKRRLFIIRYRYNDVPSRFILYMRDDLQCKRIYSNKLFWWL